MKKRLAKHPHGMTYTSEYHCWRNMRGRCYNKSDASYKNYGGRGIKVSKRWYNSFEEFFKDMGPRPEGLTLERIDNNKGYSKKNCIWASRDAQNRNFRRNVWTTLRSKPIIKQDLAKICKVSQGSTWYRFKQGWTADEIYDYYIKGIVKAKTVVLFKGKTYRKTTFARLLGLKHHQTIGKRLDQGWTPEQIYEYYQRRKAI